MIPPKTVDQILETAQIEEVVGDYVQLKRRGANMIGLCPFHNEKTPSFTVSPSKNIFKCFGCGVAGDAAKFLMEHESFTYPEALRMLAKKYGIEIQERQLTEEERKEKQLTDSLFIVNEFAAQFYLDQLLNSDIGRSVGLTYFKERGFREEIIKKFNLGYAPRDPEALLKAAKANNYSVDHLSRLGLLNRNGRDFFRDRVMFTIHNLSGKPVAFAGRILTNNKKAPKYINSPETDIYHKSKILYGFHQARKMVRQKDECILVEGYTDVLSLHQAGIEHVVASSGTSLTVEQIRLIKRHTPNVKFLFDGDAAGIKAALRGIDLVLEQDLNVKIVLLPDAEDPDSYLKKVGATQFETYIEDQAKDFIFFKLDLLLDEAKGDPVRKAALTKDIVGSIVRIPDPLKRSLYLKECADALGVEEQILVAELNSQLQGLIKQKRNQAPVRNIAPQSEPHQSPDRAVLPPSTADTQKGPKDTYQERDVIRILIAFGGEVFDKEEQVSVAEYVLANIEEVLDDFENPLYGKVAKICMDRLLDKLPISTQMFVQHADPNIRKLAIDLLQTPWEYSPGWEERWELYLTTQKKPEINFPSDSVQALLRFKLAKVKHLCEQNQERIKAEKDTEKVLHLLKVQKRLLEMRNHLAEELRTVVL